MFVLALGILLGASEVIVQSALEFSVRAGLELGLVGLTITALGTSIPEIAFSIAAIKKHAQEEILGDIIGSVVANSTLVLGIASILYPINIGETNIGYPTIVALVLTLLVFLRFSRSKEKLDTFEGFILLGMYVLFIISEFWFSMQGAHGGN